MLENPWRQYKSQAGDYIHMLECMSESWQLCHYTASHDRAVRFLLVLTSDREKLPLSPLSPVDPSGEGGCVVSFPISFRHFISFLLPGFRVL